MPANRDETRPWLGLFGRTRRALGKTSCSEYDGVGYSKNPGIVFKVVFRVSVLPSLPSTSHHLTDRDLFVCSIQTERAERANEITTG